ncbi:uncharacterized protein CANTADRAFT_43871, partial [Suhomyces tanzawaensis NRRL Y-17324]
DPIEDSSFTFLQLQPSNKTSLMDIVKWLSDSEDDLFSKDPVTRLSNPALPSVKEKSPPSLVLETKPVHKELPVLGEALKANDPEEPIVVPVVKAPNAIQQRKEHKNQQLQNKKQPSKLVNPFLNYEYTAKELKEANKITRKKEELLGEMVIHIPRSICLENEFIDQSFEHSAVEFYNCDVPLIYWTRKVRASYDSSRDIFVPCAPMEVQEKTLVLHFKAQDFISRIRSGTIKSQVQKALSMARLRQPILKYSVIIVIEGYDQYILKLRNMENKRYKDEVLKRLNESSQSKKRKLEDDDEEDITAKEANYLINQCQLDLGLNVFPTRGTKETVEWLLSFTYTIAYSIYDKYERNSSLANLGTVKSGTDPKSTFLQTIRQFKMMTEPKADKLYGLFQSIYSIYLELEKNDTLGKDGFGKNIVPPTTDSAMRKAFLGDDPNEVINE